MSIKGESSKETIAKAKRWKVTRDKKTGRTYYYHRETREARWDKPLGFDEAQKEKIAAKAKSSCWRTNVICYENNIVDKISDLSDVNSEDIVKDVENPTGLFQYLQLKYWAAALKHVEEHPREAKIWISRGLHRICSPRSATWKVLPIHGEKLLMMLFSFFNSISPANPPIPIANATTKLPLFSGRPPV